MVPDRERFGGRGLPLEPARCRQICSVTSPSRTPVSTIGRESTPVIDACYSAAFGKTLGSSRPTKRCRACITFSRPLAAVTITSTMVKDAWTWPRACNCSTNTPAAASLRRAMPSSRKGSNSAVATNAGGWPASLPRNGEARGGRRAVPPRLRAGAAFEGKAHRNRRIRRLHAVEDVPSSTGILAITLG